MKMRVAFENSKVTLFPNPNPALSLHIRLYFRELDKSGTAGSF